MNTIFKNENNFDKDLKEFFKSQIIKYLDRDKYEDDLLYTRALMDDFKTVYRSAQKIGYHEGILFVILGILLPFYLLGAFESRTASTIAFFVVGFAMFSYFRSNPSKEAMYILNSKIQAYKELLREVSQYWYGKRTKIYQAENYSDALAQKEANTGMEQARTETDIQRQQKREELFRDSLGIRLKKPKP